MAHQTASKTTTNVVTGNVIAGGDCKMCNGEKLVFHPAWEEFWEEVIFSEKPLNPLVWFRRLGFDTLPPYFVPCDACQFPRKDRSPTSKLSGATAGMASGYRQFLRHRWLTLWSN